MMKNNKLISLLLILCLTLSILVSCGEDEISTSSTPEVSNVDFAQSVKLDLDSSETLKIEATVKLFIDGDTTHFHVDKSIVDTGVLKARYLAINTPESTGKIEEYGKAAANYTKETLSKATSIYLESDDNKLNADSTGDRYLVWVWYKTAENEEYRNLNIEILQKGLAIASSSANNRYGSTCIEAINQAKAQKLSVHSGVKDPDFYYGDAVELTLKELRCNVEEYNGIKVAFEGVITKNEGSSVYMEAYDEETEMYYGISVYYGYNLSGDGLDIMSVGNKSRIVGTVTYYEAGGTYQVSGVSYRQMKPDDPNNIQKISSGNSPAYFPTTADTFVNGKVEIATEEDKKTFDYAQLAMNTSLFMENLKVTDIYTTTSEESSSKGAMTLTCDANGITVDVRTAVLTDENGNIITAEAYQGKTISVKGIVDYFSGSYQIKVLSAKDITIHD
jgi:endonuclease YncB( thermonuclease family)